MEKYYCTCVPLPWVPEVCDPREKPRFLAASPLVNRPSAGKSRSGPRETFGTHGSVPPERRVSLRHEDFAVLVNSVLKSQLAAVTHTQNAPVKLQGREQMNFIRES